MKKSEFRTTKVDCRPCRRVIRGIVNSRLMRISVRRRRTGDSLARGRFWATLMRSTSVHTSQRTAWRGVAGARELLDFSYFYTTRLMPVIKKKKIVKRKQQ